MTLPTLNAPHACSITAGGRETFAKAPDEPVLPASTIKGYTLYVARQHITDAMLDDTVTITDHDMTIGTLAGLRVGDVLTWHDLFHAMMLPSGNDAARAIGRTIGDTILGGGGLDRFVTHMADVAAADFPTWQGAVFSSSAGWPDTTSRLSARQLCQLALAWDDYAVSVAGTYRHTATITGPNARTVTLTNSINPTGAVPFPEFVAGKTGMLSGSYMIANLFMLWDDDQGARHATTVLHAWPVEQRFTDMRAVIDYVKTLPPPPPPGITLNLSDGRPATLMRSNGLPATA